jgi:hypothetical protein
MKKIVVLVVLFILPLVAYLFFASGVNNFGRLPVLKEKVGQLQMLSDETDLELDGKITILSYMGADLASKRGFLFNYNQKIYKRFADFNDYQTVVVLDSTQKTEADDLIRELGAITDTSAWKFVFSTESQIQEHFATLDVPFKLNENSATNQLFIIDKERNLRGRIDDEDQGLKYGYDCSKVADLNNKMEDDVKIILAEYRLALKKNNAE